MKGYYKYRLIFNEKFGYGTIIKVDKKNSSAWVNFKNRDLSKLEEEHPDKFPQLFQYLPLKQCQIGID